MRIWMMLAAGLLAGSTASAGAQKNESHEPAFAFSYQEGRKMELDTYKGTLTKTYLQMRDTTIQFELPQADLDSIQAVMVAIHFFQLQKPKTDWTKLCPVTEAGTPITIEATLNGKSRKLSWSTDFAECDATNPVWAGLDALRWVIWRSIHKQPEYKALPQLVVCE